MVEMGCLNEELTTIEDLFYGIDVEDYDGSVSLDEILGIAKESRIFKETKNKTTPGMD